jgi:hypothetical protein
VEINRDTDEVRAAEAALGRPPKSPLSRRRRLALALLLAPAVLAVGATPLLIAEGVIKVSETGQVVLFGLLWVGMTYNTVRVGRRLYKQGTLWIEVKSLAAASVVLMATCIGVFRITAPDDTTRADLYLVMAIVSVPYLSTWYFVRRRMLNAHRRTNPAPKENP